MWMLQYVAEETRLGEGEREEESEIRGGGGGGGGREKEGGGGGEKRTEIGEETRQDY